MSYSVPRTTRSRSSTVSSASREPVNVASAPLSIAAASTSGRSIAGSNGSAALTRPLDSSVVADKLGRWNASPEHGRSSPLQLSTSQHTLRTIRGPKSPATSDEDDTDGGDDYRGHTGADDTDGIQRGNPKFIIDLASSGGFDQFGSGSGSSSDAHSRPRSSTFGGVPLPPSPSIPIRPAPKKTVPSHAEAANKQVNRPLLSRQRSDSSLRSIPSSLHLGGASFAERRPMLHAGLKAGALFLCSLIALYVLLRTMLPPIDEEHKSAVKLPKSFDDLKALNVVLQIYKERHYNRVLGCYVTVYMFLQAFSIPGSMYLSILGGALYGLLALPLVCFCVATGALLCYFISQALGPAVLLNSEKWQRRVDAWTARVSKHNDNLISYLIVLRIAPLPPHWVVNVVAPHLGISVYKFWISTFFGIMGVSYIHVTIGTTLDQMTSSSDFHLISWQNGLGLGGIIVAVLVPVAMKRYYKKDLEQAAIDEPAEEEVVEGAEVRRRSAEWSSRRGSATGGASESGSAGRGQRISSLAGTAGTDGPSILPIHYDRAEVPTGWNPSVKKPFSLGDDDEDGDDDGGSTGAWAGFEGNMDKASKLLGVTIVR
ncbi:BQ2448_1692 [Microbotryum intermedium]|uniref:BQ2448_1692 protein n=1 Tax=Microbotryum intermedium TaxID=269621 RepID=A0A238FGM5_9BASI|nr:BQ2448_1692 [Microbotryum intermedium]